MMEDKEQLSFEEFNSILWPKISEKIIPKLGPEFSRLEKEAEEAGQCFEQF